MGRKGFIFTFISILFVSVILIAFFIQAANTTRAKTEEARVKVETVNTFLKSIENIYLNSAMKAASGRAFDAMTECIIIQSDEPSKKNKLFEEPNTVFTSIIINGDLTTATKNKDKKSNKCDNVIHNAMSKNGIYDPNDPEKLVIISNTLKDLIKAADSIGLILDFNPDPNKNLPDSYSITMTQTDPWIVNVSMPLSFNLKTADSTVEWQIDNFRVNSTISIIGLKDPLYAASDGERIPISKWNGAATDSDLQKIIDNSMFYDPIANGNSLTGNLPPSFIERFNQDRYNNGQLKCNNIDGYCGIETLRNPGTGKKIWVDYLQNVDPIPVVEDVCLNTAYAVRIDQPRRTAYNCQII
ncbi:hypothetical protein J4214_01325 [Candidatus Woesearchaeota archaeon]|nr:hypothetical protein [Candidatus Woesearchaeota archaeon]